MHGCAMRLVTLCLLAGLPPTVRAEPEETVYVYRIPPFAYVENGVAKGVIFDLVSEMQSRMGRKHAVSPVPFKRLAAKLSAEPSACAVLSRQPEFEAQYTWVVKLLNEKIVLVTRRDAPFDISSVQAARKWRAGVTLGSPAEAVARRAGFEHIEAAGTVESSARKLAAGHIDVWIAAPGVVRMGQQLAGKNMDDVRFGAVLAPLHIYLVCAPSSPKATVDRWRAAFSAMAKDGSYARILSRYHYPDPTGNK